MFSCEFFEIFQITPVTGYLVSFTKVIYKEKSHFLCCDDTSILTVFESGPEVRYLKKIYFKILLRESFIHLGTYKYKIRSIWRISFPYHHNDYYFKLYKIWNIWTLSNFQNATKVNPFDARWMCFELQRKSFQNFNLRKQIKEPIKRA